MTTREHYFKKLANNCGLDNFDGAVIGVDIPINELVKSDYYGRVTNSLQKYNLTTKDLLPFQDIVDGHGYDDNYQQFYEYITVRSNTHIKCLEFHMMTNENQTEIELYDRVGFGSLCCSRGRGRHSFIFQAWSIKR
jgi:hypothetical protein